MDASDGAGDSQGESEGEVPAAASQAADCDVREAGACYVSRRTAPASYTLPVNSAASRQ